ncbi:hypothetical protein [Planomicrobium sp. CPCC 101079]|uniref:hypothetical protein n=1 Tax=Planomicrobium sp. CPCC 101079 TaxID=2599618 RepID=UPI0011B6BEA8|nr:hypothetical protein [Planomicrobium sp. CPCC 101079]TWT03487.1 hypothetical protein FQV28_10720 [Planomicrobium sp. CPCC 101079]
MKHPHACEDKAGCTCLFMSSFQSLAKFAGDFFSKKSGSAWSALTGISRTGEAALFAAQPGWLMTRRARRWSWTKKSAGAYGAPTSAGGLGGHGAFCHGRQDRSDLEGLGAGVWTKKSAGAYGAPTSAGGLGGHGAFCHGRQDRSDLEGLGAGVWT